MQIVIKRMETDDEIKGKAFVHWRAWHDAYAGLIDADYLGRLTLEKCTETAYRWRDNILIATDGGRVVGFAGYGDQSRDDADAGELFALYILSEYYGTGVGQMLLDAVTQMPGARSRIGLWVLKENKRAIRFYEKNGFAPDGREQFLEALNASEIRMISERSSER